MNSKNIFIVIFILCLYNANSQTKTLFSNFNVSAESVRFTPDKIDVTKIISLNMLSRVKVSGSSVEDYNTFIFTKSFNWAADAFKNESYKRMFSNLYKHDRFGREYPTNINEGIINQIYLKNANFGY